MFGTQRRKLRSRLPAWVAPSGPTTPPRSMANSTSSFCDRHVVYQLVVAALQEGGIDRHHRFGAFAGHASGQRDRVLFGDGDIEIAVRVFLAETHQARAFAHRRGDAEQFVGSAAAMSHSQSPKMSV